MGGFFMEQLSLFDFLIEKKEKSEITLEPTIQEELKKVMAKTIIDAYKKGGDHNEKKQSA